MEQASTIRDELQAGQMLGRYQLLAVVGKGGMGQVWLARLRGARGFNRLVALKTLVTDPDNRERFERMMLEEARIASLIQHPNVVRTMELGEDEGLLYLVMEWVSGDSLRYLMKQAQALGTVPLRIAVHLVGQILRGLHAAHELRDPAGAPLGVVHRDVSPQNVLVTVDGEAKLLDFGIAKATNEEGSETITGEVKGKYTYMAPEQVMCGAVDRRTDLFAVGIILYEMTTGRHPFKRDTLGGTIHGIVSEEPVRPPSSVIRDFPLELERVILRALEKDPAARYPSAEDFRRELEEALPSQNPEATELEVRRFLGRSLGARERERRTAVHNAQAAGDATEPTTSKGHRVESGTSLRAISIDEEDDLPAEATPVTRAAVPFAKLEQPAPPRKRRYGLAAALIFAAAGAGFFVVRSPLTISWTSGSSAAPLSAASPVPVATPAATPAIAPSASASAPLVTPTTTVPTAAESASRAPKRPSTTTRRAPAKAAAKRKLVTDGDLIAPDYAR